VLVDLCIKTFGYVPMFQVVSARLARNRETGRHGETEIGHLGQVCTLTSEKVLEVFVSLCETEHELRHEDLPYDDMDSDRGKEAGSSALATAGTVPAS
jgi:hypothetical protein